MESKIDPIFMSQVAPIWVIECVSLYVMTGNTIITFLTSSGLNWENKPKTNYIILNGPSTLKSVLDYVKGVSLLLGKEALCLHPLVVDDLGRSFLSRAPTLLSPALCDPPMSLPPVSPTVFASFHLRDCGHAAT